MAEEKIEPETVEKTVSVLNTRKIVIELKNDIEINITQNELKPFELKEICRQILAKLGG